MLDQNFNLKEQRYDYVISQLKGIKTLLEEQKILQKTILDFKEACKFLNVSSSLLYKLTSNGEITFSKPRGGKLYFKKEELEDWCIREASKPESIMKEEAKEWVNNFMNRKGGTSND